jgi:hypothetical protein
VRIGIVGSEAAKFTPETEATARRMIRESLHPGDVVVSGACHLGGIDTWAIEEAKKLGLETKEYPPATREWTNGYRLRNIQIAEDSDWVLCFTVRCLPESYDGMRFRLCYHCGTNAHVKSGGCWTVKYAKTIGKHGVVMVVE